MYNIKTIIWKLALISFFWKMFSYCFENKNKNPHIKHVLSIFLLVEGIFLFYFENNVKIFFEKLNVKVAFR